MALRNSTGHDTIGACASGDNTRWKWSYVSLATSSPQRGSGVAPSRFFGSLGGVHLAAPIVGIADVLGGGGYYLVAKDGGVFTFGAAAFKGSLGATRLNAPIVGIDIASDLGYRLVGADGGVFNFGASTFFGSAAPVSPVNSAVAIN